ncbi:baseplate assembly protein [Vibrio phage vB_VpaM_VPs20]|uniref:Baseplate assembly protein n=1 Tax=Vibrio phage vB_VpaM_VPs20 TaxID=2978980 RepID=A0A9X9JQ77_9CAUD|nr:baseplate assembly protein [Vibrio phage vB_VpaM_VPs20]UYD72127.1 baseplate assembly protein [Vibrio phage vB_VpaM_VPs20]
MSAEIQTKIIGTIEEFDAATQMAKVRLAVTDFCSTYDTNYVNQGESLLVDVPVEFPRCNGFVITTPVAAGDDCIVDFYQSGITHWLYENRRKYTATGGEPEPIALRRFDRSDATCRVSIGNNANAISGFNTEDMQIRSADGSQHVTLKADGSISIVATELNVETSGDMNFNASGAIRMNGSQIHLNE